MLNNLMEAGHVKCHKYWPDLNGPNGGEFMFKDTNFCVRYVTEDKHDFYVLRKFTLTDLMVSFPLRVFRVDISILLFFAVPAIT